MHTMLGRLYLFAALLAIECFIRSSLPHPVSFLAAIASFGIVAFAVFLGLGYPRLKSLRDQLSFDFRFFGAHIFAVALLRIEPIAAAHNLLPDLPIWTYVFLRLLIAGLAVLWLGLACIPYSSWIAAFERTGLLWLYAALAGLIACVIRTPLQSAWTGAPTGPGHWLQVLTFSAVARVLHPILPNLYVDAPSFIMGTHRFTIYIAQECSGLEGLGLVFVFTVAWLFYFRRENRFPQAFLLVPCALVLVWILNILRIAALVLIGNSGAEEIAMVGFHSQAGWIAFTSVAFAFSMATRKLAFVRKPVPTSAPAASRARTRSQATESAATSAYLIPFLSILAAGFLSKAASGYFEWLYPIRFVAAAIAIWSFRSVYRTTRLDWHFNWRAPVTGLLVFLIWIAPEFLTTLAGPTPAATSHLAAGLDALSPLARLVWVAFRVAAAVLTVPIAEELAFRGFLARRVATRNFETVALNRLAFLPVVISSIAFGLMHGRNWPVGIVAGIAFALVLRSSKKRGGIGNAIAAHATANLLLAAWVISRHDWSQW